MKAFWRVLCICSCVAGPAGQVAEAQDKKDLGWVLTGEVSGIWTAGNSHTTTFGIKGKAVYVMERAKFQLKLATAQSFALARERVAVGTENDYTLRDQRDREKTAELTTGQTRYDFDVSSKFFVFGGADMLRNPFAGIDTRFVFFAGAGNIWAETERTKFRTDYSFTYTLEDEVVNNPLLNTNFPGARVGAELHHKLSENADLESIIFSDLNFNNTDDVRVDWKNSLPVAMSKRFFLQPSLRLMWRNQPALGDVPLLDGDEMEIGSVSVPLEKLDSIFSLSLVAKF